VSLYWSGRVRLCFIKLALAPPSLLAGYPDPEVVWLRGDEPVMESPTVQIEYEEDGRCTLVFAKVGPEDANVYTCRASNEHGEALCSAKLQVQT